MWALRRRKTVGDFKRAAFPHMDMLYDYALKMVETPDLAATLLEATYVDAHRAWEDGEARADIGAYLFRTLRNLIAHHQSGQSRHTSVPPEKTVHHVIGLLPEECATALILRDMQGHSYETISRLMQQPVAAIGNLLHSARTLVRMELLDPGVSHTSRDSRTGRLEPKSIPLLRADV